MSKTGYIYPNELTRVLKMPGGPVGVSVRRYSLDVAKEAARLADIELGNHPMDQPRTGKLAKSFTVKVLPNNDTGFEFRVSNSAKYFAPIETGSREHYIRPRRERTLHFRDRTGRWRREVVVLHPGTEPKDFLGRARTVIDRKYA